MAYYDGKMKTRGNYAWPMGAFLIVLMIPALAAPGQSKYMLPTSTKSPSAASAEKHQRMSGTEGGNAEPTLP